MTAAHRTLALTAMWAAATAASAQDRMATRPDMPVAPQVAGVLDGTSAGYLAAADRPDLARILPGPPAPGSSGARADARLFADTRRLIGTARWRQAQADVSDDLLAGFHDAIGFAIDIERTPVFARLLARFGVDRSAAVGTAKRHWRAPRPFVSNALPICEVRTPALVANGDYPSGHAANGMAFALLLAELLPDRATPLLARGRDYADSRRICGSHSASAVEGGLLAAAAIVAAAHGSADFRNDLLGARTELNALRRSSQPTVHHEGDDQ